MLRATTVVRADLVLICGGMTRTGRSLTTSGSANPSKFHIRVEPGFGWKEMAKHTPTQMLFMERIYQLILVQPIQNIEF